MPKISHIEPCDSRDLVARLEANPKILAKVLEMLELVENAEGDLRRADEAERRVIEIPVSYTHLDVYKRQLGDSEFTAQRIMVTPSALA